MNTRSIFARNRRVLVATATLLASSLLAVGCGGGTETRTHAVEAPGVNSFPAPPAGQLPYGTLNGSAPDLVQAMMGTYEANLVRVDGNGSQLVQPVTLELSQRDVQGQKYAFLRMTSPYSSPIGEINVESYLGMALRNYYGTTSFVTVPIDAAAISDYRISIELILSVRSVNNVPQLDPTQSAIFIKDCGFSQGADQVAVCSNFASDANFLNNSLVKR